MSQNQSIVDLIGWKYSILIIVSIFILFAPIFTVKIKWGTMGKTIKTGLFLLIAYKLQGDILEFPITK